MTGPGGTGAALELVGVRKGFGSLVALDGVDLRIDAGQVLALLGPNGAGKTTLVGVGSGQTDPDAGTVRVAGADPRAHAGAGRRRVGVAPQDIGVYPVLSVRDNLRFFAEAAGLSAADARARAVELAGPLLLDDLLDRRAGQLSGGQQRRLHAAIALVHRPPVVMLDEPTAGADPQTRSALLDVVRSVAAEGTAVLYTTHYLPEVEDLDADVCLLEAGRVIAQGTVAELVERHALTALVVEVAGGASSYAWPPGATVDGDTVRIPCTDPGSHLPAVLAVLGDDVTHVRRVEVVQPSLEAVYLALTGRHAVDGDLADDLDPSAARSGAEPTGPAAASGEAVS